jgi:hypothetical protein
MLTYTVVEADLPGPLVNTVIVTGAPFSGPPITATALSSVTLLSVSPKDSVYLPVVIKNH